MSWLDVCPMAWVLYWIWPGFYTRYGLGFILEMAYVCTFYSDYGLGLKWIPTHKIGLHFGSKNIDNFPRFNEKFSLFFDPSETLLTMFRCTACSWWSFLWPFFSVALFSSLPPFWPRTRALQSTLGYRHLFFFIMSTPRKQLIHSPKLYTVTKIVDSVIKLRFLSQQKWPWSIFSHIYLFLPV